MEGGDQLDQSSSIREHDNRLMKFKILPGIALDVLIAEGLLETW